MERARGWAGLLTHAGLLLCVSSAYAQQGRLFMPPVTVAGGAKLDAVAAADLDGDGDMDVVALGENGLSLVATLYVFHQSASGELTFSRMYDGGSAGELSANSVAVGDLNGDGRMDVAATAFGGFGVFPQRSDSTFDPMTMYTHVHEYLLRVADLNGDTRADIAAIEWGSRSDELAVFFQQSNGTLDTPSLFEARHGGWDDLETGDVNGDGRTDAIVMSGQGLGEAIALLLQDPAGGFLPTTYQVTDDVARAIGVGDVNDDGFDDVVAAFGFDGELAVFPGGESGLGSPTTLSPGYRDVRAIEVADVTGDGRDDVVVLQSGSVQVLIQSAEGTLTPSVSYAVLSSIVSGPHALALADVTGDGLVDAIVGQGTSSGLVVLKGTATNLGLELMVIPNPALASQPIQHAIVIRNDGPDVAQNVTLSLALPSEWSMRSWQPSQGDCRGAPYDDCQLGELAVGAEARVDLVATSATAGTFQVTASVAGYSFDPDATDDSVLAEVTILPAADVSVQVGPNYRSSDGVPQGVTALVRNDGPFEALDVFVRFQIPEGVVYEGSSWTDSLGTLGGECAQTGSEVLCSLGDLPAGTGSGGLRAAEILVLLGWSAPATVSAEVTNSIDDPVPANNVDSVTLPLEAIGPGPGPGPVPPPPGGCGCRTASPANDIRGWLVASILAVVLRTMRRRRARV